MTGGKVQGPPSGLSIIVYGFSESLLKQPQTSSQVPVPWVRLDLLHGAGGAKGLGWFWEGLPAAGNLLVKPGHKEPHSPFSSAGVCWLVHKHRLSCSHTASNHWKQLNFSTKTTFCQSRAYPSKPKQHDI